MNKTSLALLLTLAIAPAAHAAKFECRFEQEKYPSGKSNDTTCTMTPEVAFLTGANPAPARATQCRGREVYSYSDFRDYVVDTDRKTVNWDEYFGIVEAAVPQFKRKLMQEGKSPEQAEREARAVRVTPHEATVVNFLTGRNPLYWDERTNKPYATPKYVPEHFLTLRDGGSIQQLYIPESSGHAILAKYDSYEQASWVNMRFGQCRKME